MATVLETHHVPVLEQPIRLQEYAATIFTNLPSRSSVKKAIKAGRILLNAKPANTGDWIQEGQVLSLLAEEKSAGKIFKLPLKVYWEDDFLAVVHKASGYPTNGNYFKTIERALPFNLSPSTQPDALPQALPVHRLDNPTSGLLLVAKTKTVQALLSELFETRSIQKHYLAIVEGEIDEQGSIALAIEHKSAKSSYQRKHVFEKQGKTFSLVLLTPHTGRTHQLRKHLSAIGFPIVGDTTYGSGIDIKGILLTAYGLSFTHPINHKKLQCQADLPKKFRRFLPHPSSDR